MKNLFHLNYYRITSQGVIDMFGSIGDETCGVFEIQYGSHRIRAIASTGLGWDHVSVGLKNRTPNWNEMEFIKRLFFENDEVAMQLHVPVDEHISFAHNVLHLWRPNDGRQIPRPPNELVGAPKQELD